MYQTLPMSFPALAGIQILREKMQEGLDSRDLSREWQYKIRTQEVAYIWQDLNYWVHVP